MKYIISLIDYDPVVSYKATPFSAKNQINKLLIQMTFLIWVRNLMVNLSLNKLNWLETIGVMDG